jgi:hypothetical protein
MPAFGVCPSRTRARKVSEIKYHLDVNPGTRAAIRETVGEVALLADEEEYGVTYRVLGEGHSNEPSDAHAYLRQ